MRTGRGSFRYVVLQGTALLFLACVWMESSSHGNILAYSSAPPLRSLLAVSKKEMDIHPWRSHRFTYRWLSTTELLYEVYEGEWNIYKYDLATGQSRLLQRLTLLAAEGSFKNVPPNLHPSPDGKWVVWKVYGHDTQGYVLSAVDGSRYFQTGRPRGLEALWLSDSRHWIDLIDDNYDKERLARHPNAYSLLHDIDAPQHLGKVRIPRIDFLNREYALVRPDRFVYESPGLYQSDRPVMSNVFHRAVITTLTLTGSPQSVHKYTVELPSGQAVCAMKFSPSGDKVAWVLIDTRSRSTVSLWISELRGRGLHPLGEIRYADKNQMPYNGIWELQWLPDGKRLSFLYQDALWTVPAQELSGG